MKGEDTHLRLSSELYMYTMSYVCSQSHVRMHMEMHIHIFIICTHKRRKEGTKKGREVRRGQGREGNGTEGKGRIRMKDESGEELGVVVHTCKIGVREEETRCIPGAHLSPRLA